MAAVVRPPLPERVIDVDERTGAAIQVMFERRGYGRNEPLVPARLLFHADRL